jgi:predicted TIM-barrel fold metal-dependent hydrolase
MIVDCHAHLWEYPDHFNKDRPIFSTGARMHSPIEKLVSATQGIADRAIIMGLTSWNTLGITVSNDYLSENVGKHPGKFAWCCSVIPCDNGAAKEVERSIKELGAIGIGELGPAHGGYYANDRKCYPVYEKAVELGVPIIIHAGFVFHDTARMAHGNILNIDDVAIDFPELKIVISHMGWPQYETTCFLMQKHKNVFADISTLSTLSCLDKEYIQPPLPIVDFPYFHLLYPLLYHFTSIKGDPDRLLFGSDWPISSPNKYVEILTNLNLLMQKYRLPEIPQASIYSLLHENWKKVFGNGIFKS